MARSSFSSGVIGLSPLGVILPTRMSPGLTSAPMKTMPASSRFLQRLFRDVGDVARDLLGAELGVARHHLEFLDVDRGEDVVEHHPLGEQDGVLEVVAHPRHERDEHVLAERQVAQVRRGTVGDDLADLHLIAHRHQRTLVDAGVLVGALELAQPVDVDAGLGGVRLLGGADDDAGGVHLIDDAGAAGGDGGARVACHHLLHAGADQRRLGPDERHRLALHVGAHQRAVGVVVLQERDQRRGDGHQLLGRHVDVVDLVGRHEQHVTREAAGDEIARQLALGVDRRRWPGRRGSAPPPWPRGS